MPSAIEVAGQSARTLGVFQGGALGEVIQGHGSNRQGALFGSFLGYFFSVCFWTAQKVLFFCICGVCLTIFSIFLTGFEVIWALFWAFFEKQWFLENRCFS